MAWADMTPSTSATALTIAPTAAAMPATSAMLTSTANCRTVSADLQPYSSARLPGMGLMKRSPPQRAFTLVELMIVIGLIAVMISLLLPVFARVRAAAQSTACLSNLRQMGIGWTVYTSESRGRLIEYLAYTPENPDISWQGYWPGILWLNGVRGNVLLCPRTSSASSDPAIRGYGN